MSASRRRLRPALVGLTLVGAGLLLAALWIDDTGFQGRDRALGESLQQTQEQARASDLVHAAQQLLDRPAVLLDGRRGEVLDSLARAADSPQLGAALASASPAARARRRRARPGAAAAPQAVLASLAAGRRWSSALLTDKAGRVLASWPRPPAPGPPGPDLSQDPYFLALSDPGMGPGISRHGYAPAFSSRAKAPASVDLVAACGVAGPDGSFAGLLKVRVGVRASLLGPDEALFRPLLSAYPSGTVLLVLGDGRELYNSAQEPLSENFGPQDGDGRALLPEILAEPQGGGTVVAYAGTPRLAAWRRVGFSPAGAAPGDVLSLVVLIPRTAYALPAPAGAPPVFYRRREVSLPLGAGLLLLLAALGLLLRAQPRDFGSGELLLLPESIPSEEPEGSGAGRGDAVRRVSAEVFVSSDEEGEAPSPVPASAAALGSAPADARDARDLKQELERAQAALKAAELKWEEEAKAGRDSKAQAAALGDAVDAAKREAGRAEDVRRALETSAREGAKALADLEARFKARQEAEGPRKEQEAARLDAVNTLSSELKATLEVIKNYINGLLGAQASIDDGQQEFLGVVINKSARLERLIGDLVEISEIGSGAKPPRLESLAALSLLQDALVNVRPQAENKNVALELAEGAPAGAVRADRERMGAVLRGLLVQAIKVSPRNEKLSLGLAERDGRVELRITDSGMSLPPTQAAKVFTRFHGVDSQAGHEFIGAGLRFAIFKSVVEAQGGFISIESQASGKGKTFVVSLPKDVAAPGAGASPSGAVAPPPAFLGGLPPLGPPPSLGLPGAAPTAPGKPGLPVLGPPPALGALPVPGAAPPAGTLPAPGILPPLPPVAPPAPAAPVPDVEDLGAPRIHKPAPVDEALNSPWKRKQVSDDLEEELPGLPAAPLSASAPSPASADLDRFFAAPAPAPLPAAPPPSGPADLDKFFAPAPASAAPAPPPAAKTQDLAEFASLFGADKAAPAAPRPAAPPAVPPPAAAAAPESAPPPSVPKPAPSSGLGADFDALFGPPPAPPKA